MLPENSKATNGKYSIHRLLSENSRWYQNSIYFCSTGICFQVTSLPTHVIVLDLGGLALLYLWIYSTSLVATHSSTTMLHQILEFISTPMTNDKGTPR
jgi:hypothetical protein